MRRFLFEPIDIAPLVFFRIVGGLLITAEITGELLTDYGRAYVGSPVHFSYYFFDWIAPWPPVGMYLHFIFTIAMGLGVAAGIFYRATTTLFFLGQASLFLMERAVYINHTYLYCLVSLLLVFLPCHRALSFDVRRDPTIRRAVAPAWCLYLLRFQIAVVYFYAGVAKLDGDWLAGLPMQIALQPKATYPLIGPLLAASWMPSALSWSGAILDLVVVPGLLWKRTRPYAFAAAAAFHLSNVVIFGLGTFPWFSLAMTSLFFEPAAFRRLPVLATRLPPFDPTAGAPDSRMVRSAVVAGILAVYAAVQLLVPLRPFLYPGEVNWNEAGHEFSWHMMLRAKNGSVMFFVRDPTSGRRWREHPSRYMTLLEYRKMLGKPDLLLQFAHFLARRYTERGHAGVEVRARVHISLNGRPPQLLIEPTVDLAAEPRRLGPYPWVRPLEAR